MRHFNTTPPARPYLRNGIYWITFRDKAAKNGRVRQSCKTRGREEAKQKAQGIIDTYFAEAGAGKIQEGLGFDYMYSKDRDRAELQNVPEKNLRLSIDYFWTHLKAFFEPDGKPRHPLTITLDDVEAYMKHRKDQGRLPQTYKREVQALKRMILKIAASHNLPPPTFQWPKIRVISAEGKQQSGKYYPAAILDTLIAGFDDEEARDLAILIRETGVRKDEAFKLEWDMFLPAHNVPELAGTLTLPARITKTKFLRRVPLTHEAMAVVRRQRNRRPDDDTLFPYRLYSYIRYHLDVANAAVSQTRRIHLRDLRHTFGCMLLKEGLGVKATVDIMGHRTIAAADRYQTHVGDWGNEAMARMVRARAAAATAKLPCAIGAQYGHNGRFGRVMENA